MKMERELNEPEPWTRWLGRFLLVKPSAQNRADLEELLAWISKHAFPLLLLYLSWVGIFSLGAFFKPGETVAYYAVTVLIPTFAFWVIAGGLMRPFVRGSGAAVRVVDSPLDRQAFSLRTLALQWGFAAVLPLTIVVFAFFWRVEFLQSPVARWWRDLVLAWARQSDLLSSTLIAPAIIMAAQVPVWWGILIRGLRAREIAARERAARAEADRERLARVTAESELRLLQAQVEPHFLYNTLANLRYLVEIGSPDALRMSDALIEYLRTSVPDMRAHQVALGREVDHAGHYLEIMQLRLGGRLTYEIDVPGDLRDVPVPPLVVLTLVENAVKHGIAPRVEGGHVQLSARRGGGEVVLEVQDSGMGLEPSATPAAGTPLPSTRTGLNNIRSRLELTYGDAASLVIEPRQPRGTRALLRLPPTVPAALTVSAEVLAMSRAEGKAIVEELRAGEPR